jgi:hypothetical protein
MCGIYLTATTTSEYDGNASELTGLKIPTPDWLIRRGPDAWDSKEIVQSIRTTTNTGSNGHDPQQELLWVIIINKCFSLMSYLHFLLEERGS